MNIKNILKGASGDSLFLMFVRMITLIFGIVMTRVLSGHFSIHEYGTYSQIILVVATVSNLTILGMVDGINYFFSKEKNLRKRDTYVSTIFFLQCIIGVAVSLIVLGCTVPISNYFDNSDIESFIIFASILPVLQNAISLLQIMFIAIGKARHIAIRNLLVSIFKLIAIFVACYIFNNIAFVLVCQILLEIAQVVYFVVSLHRNNCKINLLQFDKSLIIEILKYCVPMAMSTIVHSLNKDFDKYVIAAFTNTETLAIYTNASKQLPFYIIMTSFCTVLLPYITRYISEKNYSQTRTIYKALLEISYISTAILAVGAICVAPELLAFLYTDKYISGLAVFIVYIVADIMSVLNITILLSAAGKTKTIMYVSIVAFFANLGLNILFYGIWGFIGPSIATLAVTTVQGVAILAFSCKEIQSNIFDMLNKKFFCLFVIELIVVGVITWGLRSLLVQIGLPSFVIMFVCYMIFVLVLTCFNFKKIKKCVEIINSCKL